MNQESNNQENWDVFHDGSEENSQAIPEIQVDGEGKLKTVHTQDTLNNNSLEPYQEFVSKLFKETPQVCSKPSFITKRQQKESFHWKSITTKQNRNTIKFMMRIFLKYHHQFVDSPEDQSRIEEVMKIYQDFYQSQQGRINLMFYKQIFNVSRNSLRNRKIFNKILSSQQIIQKQLFENGNVKQKSEYFFACKVMKIRCFSRVLCERTECQ